MLLEDLVTVSESVAATTSRSKKIALLAGILRSLNPTEAEVGVSYLSGRPRQSPLGVGYATVHGIDAAPAERAGLDILQVDEILQRVADLSGPGSKSSKRDLITGLMEQATHREQDFLRGLLLRNLRQGALEGLMAEAVAEAVSVGPDRVRRAAMLEGDLIGVAARSLVEGPGSLAGTALEILKPIQPMLAKTSGTAGVAIQELGLGFVEWKLDGARIQVHRDGGQVAVFTRNLRDVTRTLPEVVRMACNLDVSSFILDGESLLMAPGGSPEAFQDSMSRFGSTAGSPGGSLSAFFFDCLHLGGVDLIDRPLRERREALESLVPEEAQVASILTDEPDEAERFYEDAVAAGFEGVVVKDPEEPYQAGRRGSGWRKVKPTHTLDLVILAAEWGSGRRQGWLSNLHLGARSADGGFVMLGKTFKGLTDDMLVWQTERFLEIEQRRDGHIVFVEPEIVYEIAFDGVQRSTRYPGGVALRFARVKRYRDDKTPADADTIETVRSFLRSPELG